MSVVLTFAVYAAVLLIDYKCNKHTRGVLYIILVSLALLSAIPTGLSLTNDHVGASLSGMINALTR
ncbi:MAG: hypothetical protein RSC43_02380 [Clostridia bacterium]